jgi:hypothetical protein
MNIPLLMALTFIIEMVYMSISARRIQDVMDEKPLIEPAAPFPTVIIRSVLTGRIFCAAAHRKKPGYRSNSSGPTGLPVFPLYPSRE